MDEIKKAKDVKIGYIPFFEDYKTYDMAHLYATMKGVKMQKFIIDSISEYYTREMKGVFAYTSVKELHSLINDVARKRNRTIPSAIESCVIDYVLALNKEYMPKQK
jgi:hypothetical protein